MDYVIYVADTETTGLDVYFNDIIEVSFLRLTDNVQKTWKIKPINIDRIEADALRINGHKLEDVKWETKYGRETYQDPHKVIVEIENWIAEDGVPTEQRVLLGHNIGFDRERLQQLWRKCDSVESCPFGKRLLDTMQLEFFMDLCVGNMATGYSLSNLVKKYGVKNEKAHTADADVKATREVFDKQVAFFKKALANTGNE